MQHETPREREGPRSRVPTSAAMRARDVSRPTDGDVAAAEASAPVLIEARLSGRTQRRQARGPGGAAVRS